MKLPISARLLACCDYVNQNDRVADICCDHGYLGIHLLASGIAAAVIASDINESPLHSAVINAERYGVRDRMQFYLSDGVKNIPRDFDTLVCAGVGADVTVSILSAAPWLQNSRYRLILQCQSKTPILRRYLSETGWRIAREHVLRDGRFLYTVMEVLWEPGHPLSPGSWYFSPALLEDTAPEVPEYFSRVLRLLETSVLAQGEKADPAQKCALQELYDLAEQPDHDRLKEEMK